MTSPRVDIVEQLLSHGADANARDKNGETALFHFSGSRSEALEFLLTHGANVNATDKYGSTALMRAVQNDLEFVVRALLDHGANVNALCKNHKTALLLAVEYDYEDIVRLLLDRPDLDVRATTLSGNSVLMEAVQVGNVDIVGALLSQQDVIQQINRPNRRGTSVFEEIRKLGHLAIEKLLLEPMRNVPEADLARASARGTNFPPELKDDLSETFRIDLWNAVARGQLAKSSGSYSITQKRFVLWIKLATLHCL